MPNRWLEHLKKVWKVEKPKGKTYRQTMTTAKKSYRKGGKAASTEDAPKKRRRRAKKKAQ